MKPVTSQKRDNLNLPAQGTNEGLSSSALSSRAGSARGRKKIKKKKIVKYKIIRIPEKDDSESRKENEIVAPVGPSNPKPLIANSGIEFEEE